MTPEAKLKQFEDVYDKIDFCNLLQIPDDIKKIAKLAEENRLFQVYVRKEHLIITTEFQIRTEALGFFASSKAYEAPETIMIHLQ